MTIGIFIGMNEAENKSEFIKQLFLYYKPIMSKEKQIQLLTSWLESCLIDEEYEMADTIKSLLSDVNNDVGDNNGDLSVMPIEDIPNLVYNDDFIDGKLPKIVVKNEEKSVEIDEKPIKTPKKGWKLVNIWEKSYGFTLLNCQFSIKKGTFRFIIINYGVEYC